MQKHNGTIKKLQTLKLKSRKNLQQGNEYQASSSWHQIEQEEGNNFEGKFESKGRGEWCDVRSEGSVGQKPAKCRFAGICVRTSLTKEFILIKKINKSY